MRLLVDISGIAYRRAHTMPSLSTSSGDDVRIVYGVVLHLERLATLLKPREMVICWDGGSEARKALYPEYKANRKRDDEFQADFRRQLDVLSDFLKCLPVVQLRYKGVEADDIIAAVAQFCKMEKAGICTGDKDLYQLASRNHTIYNTDGTKAKLEFTPHQYLTYKVLVGDSSDNIKGVLGLGDKGVRGLFETYPTLKKIMQAAKAGDVKLGRMGYKDASAVVKRNLRLMRAGGVLTDNQRSQILADYKVGRLDTRIDIKELPNKLRSLKFASILSRVGMFRAAFFGMQRGKPTNGEEDKADSKMGKENQKNGETTYARKIKRTTTGLLSSAGRCHKGSTNGSDSSTVSGSVSVCGGRKGKATNTFTRRLRRLSKNDLETAEVRRKRKERRLDAVLLIHSLGYAEGRKWLMNQGSEKLDLVRRVIAKLEADEEYVPWRTEERELQELYDQFANEMPEWMKADG